MFMEKGLRQEEVFANQTWTEIGLKSILHFYHDFNIFTQTQFATGWDGIIREFPQFMAKIVAWLVGNDIWLVDSKMIIGSSLDSTMLHFKVNQSNFEWINFQAMKSQIYS